MEQEILLSVIVPVYNRENFLPRCLESLVKQTMESIEILVVDDGSTDASLSIIEQFQEKYPGKIRLFCQEHEGVSAARNRGMKESAGLYITFVDSDDYVDLDGYERVFQVMEAQGKKAAEVICTPARCREEDEWKLIGICPDDAAEKMVIMYYVTSNVWNKLFHRRLLSIPGVYFTNLKNGEDTCFSMVAMSWAGQVAYVNEPYYYYELTENSMSRETLLRPWIVENTREMRDDMLRYANPECREVILAVLCKQLYYIFNHNSEFQDALWEYLNQEKDFYLNACQENVLFKNTREHILDLYNRTLRLIPEIVYVNGFGADALSIDEFEQRGLFREHTTVQILCPETCDVYENERVKQAYEEKNVSFLGAYFALEKICKTGGFYLGTGLTIRNVWNELRVNRMFFAKESRDQYSERVFGGISGEPLLLELLKCCRNNEETKSFAECIDGVLQEKNNQTAAMVYGIGTFVLAEYQVRSLAEYQEFSGEIQEPLRQYYLERTKQDRKEIRRWECQFKEQKDKAYQDTLWQQNQRRTLKERLDKENEKNKVLTEKNRILNEQGKRDKSRIQELDRQCTEAQRIGREIKVKNDQLTVQLSELEDCHEKVCRELERVEKIRQQMEKSFSWKLGRVLTWLPRRIQSWF